MSLLISPMPFFIYVVIEGVFLFFCNKTADAFQFLLEQCSAFRGTGCDSDCVCGSLIAYRKPFCTY